MMPQEYRKALESGGPQRLNRVDLYGKNLILMKNLQNLGGHGPLVPPVPTPMYDGTIHLYVDACTHS